MKSTKLGLGQNIRLKKVKFLNKKSDTLQFYFENLTRCSFRPQNRTRCKFFIPNLTRREIFETKYCCIKKQKNAK